MAHKGPWRVKLLVAIRHFKMTCYCLTVPGVRTWEQGIITLLFWSAAAILFSKKIWTYWKFCWNLVKFVVGKMGAGLCFQHSAHRGFKGILTFILPLREVSLRRRRSGASTSSISLIVSLLEFYQSQLSLCKFRKTWKFNYFSLFHSSSH